MKNHFLFAKTALSSVHNLRDVASLCPTMPWAAKSIVSRIRGQAGVVVEYGPGTGAISKQIVRSPWFDAQSKLILIEKQQEFADYLENLFKGDPQVKVYRRSAAEVKDVLAEEGEEDANYFISGIPLTLIPPDVVDEILQATKEMRASRSKVIIYQCRGKVGKILRKHFPDMRCTSKFLEFLNLPPLKVYETTADEMSDSQIIGARMSV